MLPSVQFRFDCEDAASAEATHWCRWRALFPGWRCCFVSPVCSALPGTASAAAGCRQDTDVRLTRSHSASWLVGLNTVKYHSSVRALHSFASLSRFCVFSFNSWRNNEDVNLNLMIVPAGLTLLTPRPPRAALCRSAASRLCRCASCWARWWQPGAVPTGSPAPVVGPSARPHASCAARLLHKTGSRTGQDKRLSFNSTSYKKDWSRVKLAAYLDMKPFIFFNLFLQVLVKHILGVQNVLWGRVALILRVDIKQLSCF